MNTLSIIYENNEILNYNSKLVSNDIRFDISNWPKVEDAVRCYIRKDENGNFNITTNDDIINTTDIVKVAIIVESPHKDEFDNSFNPIAPLNGISGKKFDKFICNNVKKWFEKYGTNNKVFEMFIINPVQYQTSLYHFFNNKITNCNFCFDTKKYFFDRKLRNNLWIALFRKSDFICRLSNYTPQYIVNCCTGSIKGRRIENFIELKSLKQEKRISNKNLSVYVRNSLVGKFNKCMYMEYIHPCSWK